QNAPSGGSTGGEQTASDSTGAQVGPLGANAPIRVASDGDNTAASNGTAGEQAAPGDQSTTGSDGSAQVGQAGASAPIRVLSDGDTSSGGGSSGSGDQTATGSHGSAQIASPSVAAPIRVASDGDDTAAAADSGDTDTGAQGNPGDPIGEPNGEPNGGVESLGDTVPAMDILEDGGSAGDGSSTNAGFAPVAAVDLAQAGTLPLTGLGLLVLLLAGLLLVSSGFALRRGSVAAG
ncbi:MAG: hypothetical protein QOE69_2785, partial [Thermoleophilaceae bacterium]|nr:hypothetical protein [Thermoleophilaceae bacterium]